jgi:hypothetical protein
MIPAASLYAIYLGTMIHTAYANATEQTKKNLEELLDISQGALFLGILNILVLSGLLMSYEMNPRWIQPLRMVFVLIECLLLIATGYLFTKIKGDLDLNIANIVIIILFTMANLVMMYRYYMASEDSGEESEDFGEDMGMMREPEPMIRRSRLLGDEPMMRRSRLLGDEPMMRRSGMLDRYSRSMPRSYPL